MYPAIFLRVFMAASYGKNTAGCLSGWVLADDFYVLAADLKFLRLHLKKPKTILFDYFFIILFSSCGAGNKATSTWGNEYIAEEVEVYGCLFRILLVRHSPNPVYGFWPEISSWQIDFSETETVKTGAWSHKMTIIWRSKILVGGREPCFRPGMLVGHTIWGRRMAQVRKNAGDLRRVFIAKS